MLLALVGQVWRPTPSHCHVTPTIKLLPPFISFVSGYDHIEWFKQNTSLQATHTLRDHVGVWFHAPLAILE